MNVREWFPRLSADRRGWLKSAVSLLVAGMMMSLGGTQSSCAEEVPVLFPEGSLHGFLQMSEPGGRVIAGGDLMEIAKGDRVTARLVFRFKDGSIDDERSIYTQRGHLQLLTDRHIQHGPAFKDPIDVALDVASGTVTTRSGEGGQETAKVEHMELPKDLANGMMLMLLKNLPAKAGADDGVVPGGDAEAAAGDAGDYAGGGCGEFCGGRVCGTRRHITW